jgi:hypothetical protein
MANENISEAQRAALAAVETLPQVMAKRGDIKALIAEADVISRGKAYRGKWTDVHEAAIAMLWADEHGLPHTSALDLLCIVEGAPYCQGEGLLAIILASGKVKVSYPEYTADRVTVHMARIDGLAEGQSTWSLERAKALPAQRSRSGEARQHPVEKHAGHLQQWLCWRAVREVSKMVCPDVTGGLHLIGEEEEYDDFEPTVTITQEAPPPVRRTERVGSAGVDAFWRRVAEVAVAVGQDPDDLQADIERWITEHRQQSHVPDRLAEWPVDELQVIRDRLASLLESEPTLPMDIFDVEATGAEDGGE